MRGRIIAGAALLVALGAGALGILVFAYTAQGPTNSPAAQAAYWRSLGAISRQPHLRITETLHYFVSVAYQTLGPASATYRVAYAAPDRVQVDVERSGGSMPMPQFRLVLAEHSLCVGFDFEVWTCSPAHHVPIPWYLNAFLLGGQVDHLRYAQRSTVMPSGHTRHPITQIQIDARGQLGCTPTGAGAGIGHVYHWCEPSQVPGNPRVSAMLTIDRRSGLPLSFTATGEHLGKPVTEIATFSSGGPAVQLPPAHHVPCMSLVGAVHCIELGPGR
jgi:hypothetical protein